MAVLGTAGGRQLVIDTDVATRISDGPAGSIVFSGNLQSYIELPYQAFTAMYGVYIAGNESMTFDCDMIIAPTAFPNGTMFTWDVTPDPDYGGINGYLHLSYGNYDYDPGNIGPQQAGDITAMALDVTWTLTGDDESGLLAECYLTTTSHPTGDPTDKLFEIGFFPKCSPSSQAYATRLPTVGTGSFTAAGVTWNVGQGVSTNGGFPYYVATRPGYAEHQGRLDFKAFFAFLIASSEITGDEYFNGVAFGVEPQSGAGAVTIDSFTQTYS